jgi:hypothetical protein
MAIYTDPVKCLLSLNEPKFQEWLNYLDTFGFNAGHIPELIGMLSDEELHTADAQSSDIWAPVHAWRVLGQLKANQAVLVLMSILENFPDDEWAHEEIPVVCGMIGEAAIEPVRALLNSPHEDVFINIAAINCLENIATHNSDLKARCVRILVDRLQMYQSNDSEFNGFLISCLVALEAALTHIELIEAAFEAKCVDETIRGDFEDLQIDLGLLKERITPSRNYLFEKHPEMEKFAQLFSELKFAHKNEVNRKENSASKKMTYIDLNDSKPKVGRNDPCPCGSGKKFKKCCLQ